jgi:hypothetical protein
MPPKKRKERAKREFAGDGDGDDASSDSDAPIAMSMGVSAAALDTTAHRRGSILRVRMKDFLIYKQAEFRPGSGLNTIIGPNGTGKSSIVSAIVLGLAGAMSSIGRADEVKDFVKNGQDRYVVHAYARRRV